MTAPLLLSMMLMALAVSTALPGCSNAPASPTRTNTPADTASEASLIAGETWQTERITFNGLDVTAEGARTMTFGEDGIYLTTLSDGETFRGTWQLISAGTRLMLDEGAMEESVLDIEMLTATELRLGWTGMRGEETGRYQYHGRR